MDYIRKIIEHSEGPAYYSYSDGCITPAGKQSACLVAYHRSFPVFLSGQAKDMAKRQHASRILVVNQRGEHEWYRIPDDPDAKSLVRTATRN